VNDSVLSFHATSREKKRGREVELMEREGGGKFSCDALEEQGFC